MNNIDRESRSFQIIDSNEKVYVNVCVGSACHLKGSYDVINEFKEQISTQKLKDKVVLKGAFCLNSCTNAVSFRIDESKISRISPSEVKQFLIDLKEVKGWNI